MGHPPLYVTFSVRLSVCPFICWAPYLRNLTSSNHNLWYASVKWWYLQKIFFFFFFFGALDISQIIHDMVVICGTQFLNDNIPRAFFYFFKIFIFRVVRKVKWQKWPIMTKNFVCCCLYLRNCTSCDLGLWSKCVKG